jgi:hypothetical protein
MGYDVGIPTHDVGTMPLNLHIDLTLYSYMPTSPWLSDELRQHQDSNPAHLKISVSEVPSTCYAIVVKKKWSILSTLSLKPSDRQVWTAQQLNAN